MSESLPVIDIEPLRHMTDAAAVADAARQIDAACREFGFFYAAGHGIAPNVFADLLSASAAFFALPEAEKAKIAMDKGGTAWRGWFAVAGELTSGRPDLKEGLYLGEELGPEDPRVRAGLPLHVANLWPDAVPGLRPAVEASMNAATRAGEALMRGMALALGLDADHFARALTRHPTLLFRIFHYPAPADARAILLGAAPRREPRRRAALFLSAVLRSRLYCSGRAVADSGLRGDVRSALGRCEYSCADLNIWRLSARQSQ